MKYNEYERAFDELLTKGSSPLFTDRERSEIYYKIVWNNLISSFEKIFPRLIKHFDLNINTLIKDIYPKYDTKHWDLNEVSLSLIHYLENEDSRFPDYALEIALYEYSEYKVFISNIQHFSSHKDFLTLNPVHELIIFNYDIAKWVQECELNNTYQLIPEQSQNALIILRSNSTKLCRFSKLSLIGMHLYELLLEANYTENQLIDKIKEQMGLASKAEQELIKDNIKILKELEVII